MPSPVRKVARFQCLSLCLSYIRTLEFFPPGECGLVNSNFPRASRMQGCHLNKIVYLCLKQVYSVFSPYLVPAFDHFGLCYCKQQLDASFYASILLLMITFVITLSNFTAARGSTATLKWLFWVFCFEPLWATLSHFEFYVFELQVFIKIEYNWITR